MRSSCRGKVSAIQLSEASMKKWWPGVLGMVALLLACMGQTPTGAAQGTDPVVESASRQLEVSWMQRAGSGCSAPRLSNQQ